MAKLCKDVYITIALCLSTKYLLMYKDTNLLTEYKNVCFNFVGIEEYQL